MDANLRGCSRGSGRTDRVDRTVGTTNLLGTADVYNVPGNGTFDGTSPFHITILGTTSYFTFSTTGGWECCSGTSPLS